MDTKQKKMLTLLKKHYPNVKTELRYKNPWQLLVAIILSAQCTDARVNMVTPGLFKVYKTPEDFANADTKKLEKLIFSTGFYKNKAKSLIGAGKAITENFNGKVPKEMDDLITIPGVGRKTANVLQQQYWGIVTGVVVDTHIGRVSRRLGFTKHKDAVKAERDLMKLLPKKEWMPYDDAAITHGRKLCHSRKPNCEECFLNGLCPSAFKV